MKKRITLLIILCSFSLIVFAQNQLKIDSLWSKYSNENRDTTKAGILCDIGYLYFTINADSAIVLCQKGLDLLKNEAPSTSKGLCLMNMGLSYSLKGDKFSALEYFFLARDFFIATGSRQQLSDCLINIGMAEYHLKNIDKAIDYTLEALKIAEEQQNFLQKGSCFQNLGLFNQTKGNHADALDYFQKSLTIKKEYKAEPRRIANTLDAIAGVYAEMDDNQSALQYYEEAQKLRKENGDAIGYALSFYNIGVFHHKQKNFRKALNNYEIALDKIKEFHIPIYEAFFLDAIGNAYTDLGNPAKGIGYIKKSLAIRKEIKDFAGYAHTLINLADAYLKKGNTRKALETAKLFEQYQDDASPDDKLALELTLQEIWIKKNNYKKAFLHLKHANKMEHARDSLYNQKALAESRAGFEFRMAQIEHDLEIKEKENEINSIQAAHDAYLLNLFKVGIAILLGLLFLLLYNYLQKRKAHKEIAAQYIELEENSKIIDRANKNLKIVNQKLAISNNSLQQFTFAASHDLKESLRTITSFSQLIKIDEKSNLDKSGVSPNVDFIISSGKKMHKTLDDLLSYVNLNFEKEEEEVVVFQDVVNSCGQTVFSEVDFPYTIHIDTPFPQMKAKKSMVHQLVYNLIENSRDFRNEKLALKINIGCNIKGKDCVFYVKDNGVGVEPKFLNYIFEPFKRLNSRTKSGSGLGLAVCKKIVEMHGGNIWASSDGKDGTTVFFTITNAIQKKN